MEKGFGGRFKRIKGGVDFDNKDGDNFVCEWCDLNTALVLH